MALTVQIADSIWQPALQKALGQSLAPCQGRCGSVESNGSWQILAALQSWFAEILLQFCCVFCSFVLGIPLKHLETAKIFDSSFSPLLPCHMGLLLSKSRPKKSSCLSWWAVSHELGWPNGKHQHHLYETNWKWKWNKTSWWFWTKRIKVIKKLEDHERLEDNPLVSCSCARSLNPRKSKTLADSVSELYPLSLSAQLPSSSTPAFTSTSKRAAIRIYQLALGITPERIAWPVNSARNLKSTLELQ